MNQDVVCVGTQATMDVKQPFSLSQFESAHYDVVPTRADFSISLVADYQIIEITTEEPRRSLCQPLPTHLKVSAL